MKNLKKVPGPICLAAMDRAAESGTRGESHAYQLPHHTTNNSARQSLLSPANANQAWYQVIDHGIAKRRSDLIDRFQLHQATVAIGLDHRTLFVMPHKPGAARFLNAWQNSHPGWMACFAAVAGLPHLQIIFLERDNYNDVRL